MSKALSLTSVVTLVLASIGANARAAPVTSGLTLWLDADDAATRTVDGSNDVTGWTNKAVSPAFTATPIGGVTANETPLLVTAGLNGHDYFKFDKHLVETEDMDTGVTAGSFFDASQRTFVAVIRPDSLNGSSVAYFGPQYIGEFNGYFALSAVTVGGVDYWANYNYDGSEHDAYAPLTLGQFQIVVGTFSAGQLDIYLNGAAGSSGFSGLASGGLTTTLKVGSDVTDVDAGIAELLVYDHALDASDRGAVEGYLSSKWGIALVPEPASLVMLGMGGLLLLRRKR